MNGLSSIASTKNMIDSAWILDSEENELQLERDLSRFLSQYLALEGQAAHFAQAIPDGVAIAFDPFSGYVK